MAAVRLSLVDKRAPSIADPTTQVDGFAVPAGILRHFDLANTPYEDESVVEQVGRQRRAFPDQKLFLDRLLELIELDGTSLRSKLGPPA